MFGDPEENPMNWPIKQLSDVAKVDGTMTKEYEKYANLPHIGIDSIEKNTGILSGYRTVKEDNVISPKYHFGPQHILYSKIRPALNKVAVPDFEGLCSADCYPLLPIDGFCERKFLAHVLRSDYFLRYVLSFSVRSQMPKVNRKQLEGFRFPCPPVELQRKFIILVEQSDKSKFVRFKSQFIEMFGDPLSENCCYKKISILDACDNITGGGTPSKKHPEYYEGSIPWVSPKDMNTSIIEDSQDHITEEAITKSTTKLIPEQSVLMVIRSGVLKHDLPIAINKVPVTINQDMKAFLVGSKIIPQYLFGYFKTIEADVLRGVRAVTADNIEFKVFQKRLIQIPPMDEQQKFAEFMIQSDKSK